MGVLGDDERIRQTKCEAVTMTDIGTWLDKAWAQGYSAVAMMDRTLGADYWSEPYRDELDTVLLSIAKTVNMKIEKLCEDDDK